jgi:cytochrome c-type biogenesis protein CcmH
MSRAAVHAAVHAAVLAAVLGMTGLVAPGLAAAQDPEAADAASLEARARALEVQLIAPCCKNQTLDVHDSPVTRSMKREIRERLAAGDAPEAILRGFEERYGAEVRAVSSPGTGNALGAGLAVVGCLAACGTALLLLRWRRGGSRASAVDPGAVRSAPPVESGERTVWDERLDKELQALDR